MTDAQANYNAQIQGAIWATTSRQSYRQNCQKHHRPWSRAESPTRLPRQKVITWLNWSINAAVNKNHRSMAYPPYFNQPIDRPTGWHGETADRHYLWKLRQGGDFALAIPTQKTQEAPATAAIWAGSVKVIWYQALKQWWKNVGKWLFCAISNLNLAGIFLKSMKTPKDVRDVYRKTWREILYQRMAPQALDDWMQDLRAQAR